MGCRTGCMLFERFSTALEFIAKQEGCDKICHVLDDFLRVTPSEQEARKQLTLFQQLYHKLGVPLAEEKTETNTKLIFLGIELDTIAMEARLPQDKLARCRSLTTKYQKLRKITVKKLESLTGILNFACGVVTPGRPFMRRLYQRLWGVQRRIPHHRVRLTKGAREDLKMWSQFFKDYNGITMFLPNAWSDQDSLHFYTDAARTIGFGIVFGTKYAFDVWPKEWKDFNIALLEFYPIVVAFKMFGESIQNKRVLLHIDNQAVVHIINKQTSKDPYIMVLVRELVLTILKLNVEVRAEYISTKENFLADFLSRQQVQEFRSRFPEAEEVPTCIPEYLLPHNFNITYNAF